MKPFLTILALLLISCGGKSGSAPPPPPPPSSVTLTWEAPNQRENNECLPEAELGGFLVSYGTESIYEHEQTVVYNLASCAVEGQGSNTCGELRTCRYELVGVTGGYFAVRAFDSAGLVSGYSNTVTK